MLFFSSDHHFGHKNIMKLCNRPWESVGEMDSDLIKIWNAKVSPKDTVWYLGDFAFTNNFNKVKEYFDKLNGAINFITGNHDNQKVLSALAPAYDYKFIRWQKEKIVLFHYPIRSWQSKAKGAWHLYGHSHGTLENTPNGKSMDIGVDAVNMLGFGYSPISFDEVKKIMITRETAI